MDWEFDSAPDGNIALTGELDIRQSREFVLALGFSAPLPQACVESAARFCPGLPSDGGRVLACLYARSDRVDALCVSAVRSAVGR